jgi:CO dehydrogenase maturation factor
MKIAISGKGGVGKTTVAALLARLMVAKGKKVLAIDADPVASLANSLGMKGSETILPISEMKGEIESRTGAKAGTFGAFFKLNPKVDDMPDKFFKEINGVRMMVMGTVDHGGGGCVCPEAVLLKALVGHLLLQRDEVVILDLEAGVEHLGRGTAHAVNLMIAVVEPGTRSMDAAKQIRKLAADIGLKNVAIVANKVRTERDLELIKKGLPDFDLLGTMPYDDRIIESDLSGEAPFLDGNFPEEILNIYENLLKYAPKD